ncbi:uncharacterized protein LOC142488163 [Ascaphus truei]|uniref:uncharacterized protein LOC142488163 n=1 Tax=Ascaphus truei TaxID=8439 RepID=UPI003F5A1E71
MRLDRHDGRPWRYIGPEMDRANIEINIEYLEALFTKMRHGFQEDLSKTVHTLQSDMNLLAAKTDTLKNKVEVLEQAHSSAEDEINRMQFEIRALRENEQEQENRDRRQNLQPEDSPRFLRGLGLSDTDDGAAHEDAEEERNQQPQTRMPRISQRIATQRILAASQLPLMIDPNMVADSDQDRSSEVGTSHSRQTEKKAKEFRDILKEFSLNDIWRAQHQGQRDFMFYSTPNQTYSRIDYFLGTKEVFQASSQSEIGSIFWSDYAPVELVLSLPFSKNNQYNWKLNDSLLNHLEVEVAPGGHVSPEMEQVSSPGSASSTLLEEHHGDEDDEYDEDDATEETEIQSCDHEEVPIETVVPPNRPSTSTYDAIVASEGKIVDAENRRHSDMMTVLERMIGLQEETVSQLAHLHRVFIEVPKQLQKINTSFEALVVQQTQANYWRMTNVPQFNTSQPGSVHAGQFSPHSSDIHSPGPNVTGQVADIAVQVPDDILPLPSVQIQQQTPTKEATKTKQDTHETDQPSLVQCLPTCSHVSLGTSPVREQSLPKSPVGESLPKSPVGESLPKSPVGESLPKSPVGESLPKSPVGESLATSPVGESLATSPVGEQSLATSPAREVPEATQSGSVVPKVGGKRKIQETTSRPVTRSQKEQKK